MFQKIELADAYDPVEIEPGLENIIVKDKFNIINNAVINILSVTSVVDTFQSRAC